MNGSGDWNIGLDGNDNVDEQPEENDEFVEVVPKDIHRTQIKASYDPTANRNR